ncbi:MAG TPA: hypothetical protein VHY09_04565, partial [Candidatus Methylacidiphilales bacterium]|nr:hypothetical protein [Candidatus Methylacidiphilales bacterium]
HGLLALGLVLAGVCALTAPALADQPAKPAVVLFLGYQSLNGQMLVQLRIMNPPAVNQPGLLKTGDKLDLGPCGKFTVGKFHQGQANGVDTSTLELIDSVGHKTMLQFRRATEVKPASGALTRARFIDARATAPA